MTIWDKTATSQNKILYRAEKYFVNDTREIPFILYFYKCTSLHFSVAAVIFTM
jgi:ABC-type methionine transport system permease subunit